MKKTSIRAFFGTFFIILTFFATSCGSGSNIQIPGINGPFIILEDGTIAIHMEFENILSEGYAKFPIPKFEDSYVELGETAEKGLAMTFKIDISELLSFDDSLLPPITIPFNRPIPGIPSGALPGVSFTVEDFENTTFYISPTLFGVFVPFEGIDLQGSMATFRYYIGEKKAGTISLVGEDDQGNPSGLLLLLNLDSKTKKYLKRKAR
ncbi:MAG: hypothetical protein KAQ98_02725 [Bacteriovoracaceae bacterium]|nr:hypothetical protein [Bacteriovoracaceae bacterium]